MSIRAAGRPKPFTPRREDPGALDDRTVGREPVLALIHQRLTAAAETADRTHTLFLGPRGAGKSHLLAVAERRLGLDDRLAARLVVVRTPEDVVGHTRFADVLDVVLASLTPTAPRPARDVSHAQRQARIHDSLGGRVLVLVVENFVRLLEGIGLGGQRDFRAWVEGSGDVLILASSPSLGPTIEDRAEPWFGGVSVVPLTDLTVEQGQALLVHNATARGDEELEQFVRSEVGRSRVHAAAQLTGGSPRLWTILSDVVSVATLDDLVLAVEDLLESLVGYYQQLLWELAPNEQRIVRALAEHEAEAMTVAQISDAAQLDQRVASVSIRRLERARWVVEAPRDTGDQRRRWYRLREPLLRHHFQYRSGDPEPLRLIVSLLRAWFSETERRQHLLRMPIESEASRLLAATWSLTGEPLDSAYTDRNPVALQSDARRWRLGYGVPLYSREVGALIDWCVAVAQPNHTPAGQEHPVGLNGEEVQGVRRALEETHHSRWPDRIGAALQGLLAAREDADPALRYIGACWNALFQPTAAVRGLRTLLTDLDNNHPLRLDVMRELGFWLVQTARTQEGLNLIEDVLHHHESQQGADHPDALSSRSRLAYAYLMTGDLDRAVPHFERTLSDRERVLGPGHPDTLVSRNNLASAFRAAGDLDRAISWHEQTLADAERELGSDHPRTLTIRGSLAYDYLVSGDLRRAIPLLERTLSDRELVLGPGHPHTSRTRAVLADALVSNGSHGDAARLITCETAWWDIQDAVSSALSLARRSPDFARALVVAGTANEHLPATIADLFDALGGSAEALQRLPRELATLLDGP